MSNHPTRVGARADATPTAPLAGDPAERPAQGKTPQKTALNSLLGLLVGARATWSIVALSLLLTSTSLSMGLTGDDHLHTLMLRQHSGVQGLSHHTLDLFAFATNDSTQTHGMVQEGLFPWWSDPQVVISFFRPLSSATHWLDHQLWPNRPALMHLHSMLWLGLLLFAASRVYGRFFAASWVSGFALLLYAVDDARAAPVGWIANRNAMIAAIPSLFALVLHDRARRDRHRLSQYGAPLCFARAS